MGRRRVCDPAGGTECQPVEVGYACAVDGRRIEFSINQANEGDDLSVVAANDPSLESDAQAMPDRLGQGDRDALCVFEPYLQTGNSDWGVTTLRTDDGAHLIESRSDLPFGIMVYACNDCVSYVYPGGMALTMDGSGRHRIWLSRTSVCRLNHAALHPWPNARWNLYSI
jgi:hypothetical protein